MVIARCVGVKSNSWSESTVGAGVSIVKISHCRASIPVGMASTTIN
jgi:hypothetical protein